MNAPNPLIFKCADELDVLGAILTFDRRAHLAGLLSDDDVATLKHLAGEDMGADALRALTSDLIHLEACFDLATDTGDVLAQLIATCVGDRFVNIRGRALLFTAVALGGHRLINGGEPLPCLTLCLGRTFSGRSGTWCRKTSSNAPCRLPAVMISAGLAA